MYLLNNCSYRRKNMFNWLKKLFGSDVPDTPVIAQQPKEEVKSHVSKVVNVEQAKKPASKKSAKTDLDSMSKNDLLAHAKANGIKANASMKKADILAAINNG